MSSQTDLSDALTEYFHEITFIAEWLGEKMVEQWHSSMAPSCVHSTQAFVVPSVRSWAGAHDILSISPWSRSLLIL